MDGIDAGAGARHAHNEHRAELQAQQRREENARLNFSATKLERLPSVSAFANYGDIGTSVYSALPTRSIGASVRDSDLRWRTPRRPPRRKRFAVSPGDDPHRRSAAIKSSWTCASRSTACTPPTRR